ncbi:MAG: GGDEF domain-containing protein [Woeseia sp.]|nr:GGDEF domain-containing protein [Woeseia sp.]MBT8095431.1 GGDEF domain-containing protein [Woeseia sp.]
MPYIGYFSNDDPQSWTRTIVVPGEASEDERTFRRYFQRRTLPMAQVAVLVAIFLMVAVCILDWVVMPLEFALPAIQFRAFTMLPLLVALFAASLIWPTNPKIPYGFMAVGALNGIGTVIVGGIAARSGIEFVLWGTIFVTFYVYLVCGLRFRQATIAGWPVFLTYFIVGIFVDAPFVKMAYGTLFLVFTNLIGMYAAFLFEWDARELYQKNKQLQALARTDGLTGIDNRRCFDKHLSDAWRQARREQHGIAVLLVDVDYFKLYNDFYGHKPGDACLQHVAATLAKSVHRPLDQVARYGGEEFAIVLYNPNKQFVCDYADELVRSIAKLGIEHKASDIAENVTISVGAAMLWPDASNEPDQLVRRADDALYEAKTLGRNRAAVHRTEKPIGAAPKVTALTA